MLKTFRRQILAALVLPVLLLLIACDPSSLTTASPPLGDTSNVPGAQSPTQTAKLSKLKGTATVVFQVKGKPGTITVAVDGNNAPITAGNFVDLVNKGVYNGTRFHRVIRQPEPFVAQGGDPRGKDAKIPLETLGDGSFIDPETSKPRYIPLEILPEGQDRPVYSQTLKGSGVTAPPKLKHTRGAVAMARTQLPDSASAQFYFALADLPFLDGDYAVFGYVTQGMELVDTIQQGDTLESVKVTQGLENLQPA
jgi:peptidyl-prolyl cis-trans isomerase B (cyclophilin B)